MGKFLRTLGDICVGIIGVAFFAVISPIMICYSVIKHFTTSTEVK